VTLGILCGCLVGVAVTVIVVLASEGGGSNDGTGWAWLDVVRIESNSDGTTLLLPVLTRKF
jgi:hypothetical protein